MPRKKNVVLTTRQIYRSEYRAWVNMLHRCHNPRHAAFENYGGRGISVCNQWRDYATGFDQFLADVGPKPIGEYSIERKNNDGNYSPDNCLWADRKTQQRNRRRPRRYILDFGLGFGKCCSPYIEYQGRIQTLSEWADELGIRRLTVRNRLKAGFSIAEAFNPAPIKKSRKTGTLPQITLH